MKFLQDLKQVYERGEEGGRDRKRETGLRGRSRGNSVDLN